MSKAYVRPAIAKGRYNHICGFHGRLIHTAALGFSFLGFIQIGIVVVLRRVASFFYRVVCDAMQSAVLLYASRPSVMLRYCDDALFISSPIILALCLE